MHYIRYDVLYAYVLARLQYWSMMVQKDEDKLLKRLLNASDRERNSAKKKQAAELPAELLNTLIEKITVHEAVKGEDGSREQEVEIYYRFIGKID